MAVARFNADVELLGAYKAFKSATAEIRENRDCVLRAVREVGIALEYASESLRRDPEVVLVAVKQDGWALEYAAEELQANRTVALEAVRQDGWTLEFVAPELRSDRVIVLAAVQQNWKALQFASPCMRGDREVVYTALLASDDALKFVCPELAAEASILSDVALLRSSGQTVKMFCCGQALEERNTISRSGSFRPVSEEHDDVAVACQDEQTAQFPLDDASVLSDDGVACVMDQAATESSESDPDCDSNTLPPGTCARVAAGGGQTKNPLAEAMANIRPLWSELSEPCPGLAEVLAKIDQDECEKATSFMDNAHDSMPALAAFPSQERNTDDVTRVQMQSIQRRIRMSEMREVKARQAQRRLERSLTDDSGRAPLLMPTSRRIPILPISARGRTRMSSTPTLPARHVPSSSQSSSTFTNS